MNQQQQGGPPQHHPPTVHIQRAVGELPGITQPVRYPSSLPLAQPNPERKLEAAGHAVATQRLSYGHGHLSSLFKGPDTGPGVESHPYNSAYTTGIPGARTMLVASSTRGDSKDARLGQHAPPAGNNLYGQQPTLLRVGSHPSLLSGNPSSVFSAHAINGSIAHRPNGPKLPVSHPQGYPSQHPSHTAVPVSMPFSTFSANPQYISPSQFTLFRGSPHPLLQVGTGGPPQQQGMVIMGPPGVRIIHNPNGNHMPSHYPLRPASHPPHHPNALPTQVGRLHPVSRLDLSHPSETKQPLSSTPPHRPLSHHNLPPPSPRHSSTHQDPPMDRPADHPLPGLHLLPNNPHLPPHHQRPLMPAMSNFDPPKIISYGGRLMQVISTQQHHLPGHDGQHPHHLKPSQPILVPGHANGRPVFMMHMPMIYATHPGGQPLPPHLDPTAAPPNLPPGSNLVLLQPHMQQPPISAPLPATRKRPSDLEANPHPPAHPQQQPTDKPRKKVKKEEPAPNPAPGTMLRREAPRSDMHDAVDSLPCMQCGCLVPALWHGGAGELPICSDCSNVRECPVCNKLTAAGFEVGGAPSEVCAQCCASGGGDMRVCSVCSKPRPAHAYTSSVDEREAAVCAACKSFRDAALLNKPPHGADHPGAAAGRKLQVVQVQGGAVPSPHWPPGAGPVAWDRSLAGSHAASLAGHNAAWSGALGQLAAAAEMERGEQGDEAEVVVVEKDVPANGTSSADGAGGRRTPTESASAAVPGVKEEAGASRNSKGVAGVLPATAVSVKEEPSDAVAATEAAGECARSRPYGSHIVRHRFGDSRGVLLHQEASQCASAQPAAAPQVAAPGADEAKEGRGGKHAKRCTTSAAVIKDEPGMGLAPLKLKPTVAANLASGDVRAKLREVAMRAAAAHRQEASAGALSSPNSPLRSQPGTPRSPCSLLDVLPGSADKRGGAGSSFAPAVRSRLQGGSVAQRDGGQSPMSVERRGGAQAGALAGLTGAAAEEEEEEDWAASIHLLAQAALQVEAMEEEERGGGSGEDLVGRRRAKRGAPIRRGWEGEVEEMSWDGSGVAARKGQRAQRRRRLMWRHALLALGSAWAGGEFC